jgi:hypothetical protein
MTWDQFTDVLPIITLILGYGGTRLSDRWRERGNCRRPVGLRGAVTRTRVGARLLLAGTLRFEGQ